MGWPIWWTSLAASLLLDRARREQRVPEELLDDLHASGNLANWTPAPDLGSYIATILEPSADDWAGLDETFDGRGGWPVLGDRLAARGTGIYGVVGTHPSHAHHITHTYESVVNGMPVWLFHRRQTLRADGLRALHSDWGLLMPDMQVLTNQFSWLARWRRERRLTRVVARPISTSQDIDDRFFVFSNNPAKIVRCTKAASSLLLQLPPGTSYEARRDLRLMHFGGATLGRIDSLLPLLVALDSVVTTNEQQQP